jgi:hypothetical protein
MDLLYMLALWSNVCVIQGCGSIGFMTLVHTFDLGFKCVCYTTLAVLKVRLDRTANVTYDMLFNG